MTQHNTIHSLEEMKRFAEAFAKEIDAKAFCVVTLQGDLAAGKTTFTQSVAKYLGVKEHVQSPTYALLRSYPIEKPAGSLHHLDLYRVESLESLEHYGIIDLILAKKGIFFIEWPELLLPYLKVSEIVPISIHITVENATTRKIIVD